MGASESALKGADGRRHSHPRGVTCIAAAAETHQRILHIPLVCGATTSVDFSTVLGEGSYGVVYGGSVDRSTCRHCPEGGRRLTSGASRILEEDSFGYSRQSSVCSRQGCQHCFSDRTRQVAVKALRHSSQRQQRFFINRFKFLQLVRLQQLLVRSQDIIGSTEQPLSADVESATSASSNADEFRSAVPSQAINHEDRVQKHAAVSNAPVSGSLGATVSTETRSTTSEALAGIEQGGSCSCCKFLQFPSFDSLHLLQVFGVYACSRVSREYLVMEKLSGPTLFDYLRLKYSEVLPKEWEACQIIVPILKGLACIHGEGFIHGDIKLENIMFRSSVPHPSTLTLVDLDGLTPLPCAAAKAAHAYSVAAAAARQQDACRSGNPVYQARDATSAAAAAAAAAACNTSLSSLLSGEGNALEGLCCTPQYLPIEVVREKKLSPFADLHAVGCICYMLMEGCFPHERINLKSQGIMSSGQICQKLSRDVVYPRVKQKYSPLCENFMRKLLSSDSKYRFGSAGEALTHPWIEYARSLQSPEEVEQERKLLRSVLAAADEAAEKAAEAANKAKQAAREQAKAEAAAATAAAIAAEAAALEAEAARRAAQEAEAAAAAAAKKAEALQKARQAAVAAEAARAEKTRAERAAEESAAAVVALAQCQAAGGLENADRELQLLLTPRASAGRRNGGGLTDTQGRTDEVTHQDQHGAPFDSAAATKGDVPGGSIDAKATNTVTNTVSTRENRDGLQRGECLPRGGARCVAPSRSPRTPRRRGDSLLRAHDSGRANGSPANDSVFVLLDRQQRAFAKRGAAAAAACPSISGAVRAVRLLEQPNPVQVPPAEAPTFWNPLAAGCNTRGTQESGDQHPVSSSVTGNAHLSPTRAGGLTQRQRWCADINGQHLSPEHRQQQQIAGNGVEIPTDGNSRKVDDTGATQHAYAQGRKEVKTVSPEQDKQKEGPVSWYNGIVNFLEVVSLQSPRENVRLS